MYCKNCGSQINDGSLFCPVCGARSEEQPVQPSAPAYEAPEPLTNPEPKKRGLNGYFQVLKMVYYLHWEQ